MASTITDGNGRKWIISGSTGPLKRIREFSGVDLGQLYNTEKLQEFNAILENRSLSLKVIQAACGDEALQVSEEAWDDAWPVDLLTQALFDLGKEVARFFTPLQSRMVISAMERLNQAYQHAGDGIQSHISELPLPSIELSTSEESSASTPAS